VVEIFSEPVDHTTRETNSGSRNSLTPSGGVTISSKSSSEVNPKRTKQATRTPKRTRNTSSPNSDAYSDGESSSSASSSSNYEEEARKPRPKATRKSRTGYRGVTYDPTTLRYRARIKIDGKTTHIGYYLTATEAAMAFDAEAEQRAKYKVRTNFPLKKSPSP